MSVVPPAKTGIVAGELENRDTCQATQHAGATLAHGDFNSRNLLVRRDAGGRWSIAAILDWEFAFAGSVYCDIGNFLRYERAAHPRFEPAFSRGLRDGGVELSADWRRAARMADLPALCELLTRESAPENVVAELVELVRATIEDRDVN